MSQAFRQSLIRELGFEQGLRMAEIWIDGREMEEPTRWGGDFRTRQGREVRL